MKSWTLDPKKFHAETKKEFQETVAVAAMKVYQNLVFATPVDTGRARSNWIASIGRPARGTRGASAAGDVILQASATFQPDKIGEFPVLYIANNLDYVVHLNNGSSAQAPANFVELAVDSVL